MIAFFPLGFYNKIFSSNNCLKEFLQSVQRVPQAVSLLAKLCREANMRDILKLLYSQTENHMSYGMIEVADSYQFLNVNDRIRGLKAAETFFQVYFI